MKIRILFNGEPPEGSRPFEWPAAVSKDEPLAAEGIRRSIARLAVGQRTEVGGGCSIERVA